MYIEEIHSAFNTLIRGWFGVGGQINWLTVIRGRFGVEGQINWLTVDKESPKPTTGGCGRHAVHDRSDGPWHDGGDLVGEHAREQRGKEPHGGLQPTPVALGRPFELAKAPEQEEQVNVGDDHKRDRPWVVDGAVHRRGRVVCQERQAESRKPLRVVCSGHRRQSASG